MKLNQITLALLGLGFAQFAAAENGDNSNAMQPETAAQAEASAQDSSAAQTQTLQNVTVQADRKTVRAAKSFSIASDGDMRDRVNLSLLGRANAFTAPITVVNYDEKMLNNKQARTLTDAIASTDASVMAFGGECVMAKSP